MNPKNSLRSKLVFLYFALSVCGCGMTQSDTSINPRSAAVAPGQTISFTATIAGRSSGLMWFVNGVQGGSAATGTIDPSGNFTAPSVTQGVAVSVSATMGAKSATANVAVIPPGTVTPTANPQVASYTISPPVSASVAIQFGLDTNYGLTTWTQMGAGNDAPTSLLVAGMRAATAYHMRAVVTLSDGTQFNDADHTFTTASINTSGLPQITVTTPSGMTPQPGIEMINVIAANATQVFATDISGNVIWTYTYGGTSSDFIQPIKLLPNGHLIVCIGSGSSTALAGPPPAGTIEVIREIDLAGSTIRELDVNTLNQRLAAAGFNLVVDVMHHEITPLPNGHFLVLTNSTRQFTNLNGFPGTTNVLGDQVVDLDANWNPVWVWDEFDHLDVNRHPMNFPDWTHTNAIVYSKDDGNIIISIRHQNWLIKINYQDGHGDGSILWRLGEGGDFTLKGGVDPTDWFWAQHAPSFASTNTSGVFSLALFDDGNDRQLAPGAACGTPVQSTCLSSCACYSTGEVFQLDENAKTATITFHDFPNLYSFFGGSADVLPNGNLEYDLCAGLPTGGAVVVELPQQENPRQVAWQMNVSEFAYRAFRLPSLYPGVQW